MAKYIEPHVSSIEQVTVIGAKSVQSTTNRVLCIFAANCGPLEPTEINNQSEFLKTYTEGGAISRKAHTSFLHALKHAQSLPLLCVRVSADKVTKGVTNTGVKVFTKGDKVLNYVSSKVLTIADTAATKPSEYVALFGDYLFCNEKSQGGAKYTELYSTSVTPVVIDPEYSNWPTDGKATHTDLKYFFDQIAAYLNKYADMSAVIAEDSTGVKINNVMSNTAFVVKTGFGTENVTVESPTQTLDNVAFVVSPNAPATTNIFGMSISGVTQVSAEGEDYYRFSLNIESKGESNSYALSTYPEDTDSTGANMYLESVNELQSDFTVIPVDDNAEVTELTQQLFGATDVVTKYDKNTLPLELLSQAIADVEELEGVRISILSDCGLCQPAYQKKLTVLAETLKAIPALSCPDSKVIAYVTNYVKGAGIDSSFAWWGYPWNTDKALCDFPVNLSAVAYYIERIAANASGNQEFAPVFGKTTGISTGRNLHYNATLNQRNELQAYNINPIHYSKADNIAYFTNDLTALSQNNVLQEEQTRRIINKIRYEVDLLCDGYLSYDWDQASCDLIKSGIQNYFDKTIKTMLRTIEGDPVINVTLNGLNKVKVEVAVQPKGSIKYINVYYNVLSMAS